MAFQSVDLKRRVGLDYLGEAMVLKTLIVPYLRCLN